MLLAPSGLASGGTVRRYEITACRSSSGSQLISVDGMKTTDRPSRLMPCRISRASSPSE